ncbi:hypothetical protein HCG99_06300 [Enterobacter ludwigii]|nr:hypothetical protein [Enterobacter ludwigii]MBX9080449.1 hypothetical protein [Enterobacter ludwigii]QLA08256.1 hypothetical protein HWQ18_17990 [Enterobacter ludwigii]HDR2552749.1 hypothetical protein [Enterobacter ludwigii]HDR2557692.1 hypothetical protein [Enterobacter ludwigii]
MKLLGKFGGLLMTIVRYLKKFVGINSRKTFLREIINLIRE